jgi:eukaryotic-like serine/threonine-protein kinase
VPDFDDVELRIAVAEGLLSRAEADALGEEARRKRQSPLALLVEQGRLSADSFASILAEAMSDPAWRPAGQDASASTYIVKDAMMDAAPAGGDPPFPVAGWDRYTCVRFLGQGGMGMVFLAVDTWLRREVAIKFVLGSDADHVRRQLISEARNQARVSHERIRKVYEVGEINGKVYIAMQYIAGKSLDRMADELTLEQKVTLVRGAAEGMNAAHSEGIIHRDIKPSNILVERSGDGELRAYVLDFGLSHTVQDSETLSGAVAGTPHYMAPEQALGATSWIDRRTDVYSLGATLYHLLTGAPAVTGETIAEVIHNVIDVEPRPLRAHDPSIPADLETIVLKCLEKDRSARYDSARALADDLSRFLNGEPVRATPGTWYRLRTGLAKHYPLITAFAAFAVAGGFGFNSEVASPLVFLAPLVIAFLTIVFGEYMATPISRGEGAHEYDA